MGFYDKYILPRLVHITCGQKPTMRQRQKVVPLAEGRVLEIGIGSGLNIPFYDTAKVQHLWGLEPSEQMWAIARKNARQHHLEAEFVQSGAESSMWKPGGKLIFCEHGTAPDENVQRWQNRLNPLWKKLSGGCHLNRPIPGLLSQAGFRSDDMQTMYLPGWKPASFNYWGTARYK